MSPKRPLYSSAKGWTIPLILGAIAISMVLIACGSSAQPDQAGGASTGSTASSQQPASGSTAGESMAMAKEPVDYASLSGDIDVDGSSTVFPITEAVAEEFGKLTEGNVRVTVGVSGTGGGFKKFCNGETQVSDASRPIKASEVALCEEAGIEYIEIPVAIDGLTVIVNKDNTWAQCMTVEELNTMWAPEAEDVVTKWDQVRPGWPSDEMEMYAPGVDSGTFDYFTETIGGESGASRGDFTASEDDNLIIQGVSGGKNGVGYLGYSYYVENAEKLNAVEIDGGSGCIAPTDVAINNGTYAPLSRPLFIYVRKDAATTPHIAEFIRYYLGSEGQALAAEVGYIPYPQAVYDLALAKFENGTAGTAFGGENPMHGSVEDILANSQQPGSGGSSGESMAMAREPVDYASLSGDIDVDGSSTVFPITEAVAEEFGKLTEGNVRVTVGVSGTGGGFKKFCNGETQVSDASRPIKASEVALCEEAGIEYIEIPVAIDGLTVIVNKDNTWAQCMTVEELNTMWAPEAEDVVTKWDQVRSGWPSDEMEMYAPGVDSGTFDYFTETIGGESGASRGDFTASEDDNLIIQGVSGGKNGVGYLGYSYYVENAEKLNAVEIDGGSGCIAPTDVAINNGTYAPLSRPLFIYVRKDAATTPHIAEFIRYYLGSEGQALAAEVGYIPYPQPVYDLALAKFENGTAGTAFGGENPMHGPVEDILANSQ